METPIRHRAYVIGGERKFVEGTLSKRLMAHGIKVEWLFDWNKERQGVSKLPSGCTLVLCLKDMIGHRMRDPAHKLAKKAGISAYDIQRKWCQAAQTLLSAGVIQSVHPEDIEEDMTPAKQYYEDLTAIREYVATLKGRRPSPAEVAEAVGVEPGFLGMLRGINEGIALAQAASAKRSTKARKEEIERLEEEQNLEHARDLCIMTFEDDPRLLLDVEGAFKFVKSCFSEPPPTDAQLKQMVVEAAELCRRAVALGTKRGRRKPEEEADAKRLTQMRKMFARNYIKESEAEGRKVTQSALQKLAINVFGSKIPKVIMDEAFSGKAPKEKVEIEVQTNTQDILMCGHLMGKMADVDAARAMTEEMGKKILAMEVTQVRESLGIPAFISEHTHEPDVLLGEGSAASLLEEIEESIDESIDDFIDEAEDVEALDAALEAALEEELEGTALRGGSLIEPDPEINVDPTPDHHEPGPVLSDGPQAVEPELGPVVPLKVVEGADQAALIGEAIAMLMRAGCKVAFSVITPNGEDVSHTVGRVK